MPMKRRKGRQRLLENNTGSRIREKRKCRAIDISYSESNDSFDIVEEDNSLLDMLNHTGANSENNVSTGKGRRAKNVSRESRIGYSGRRGQKRACYRSRDESGSGEDSGVKVKERSSINTDSFVDNTNSSSVQNCSNGVGQTGERRTRVRKPKIPFDELYGSISENSESSFQDTNSRSVHEESSLSNNVNNSLVNNCSKGLDQIIVKHKKGRKRKVPLDELAFNSIPKNEDSTSISGVCPSEGTNTPGGVDGSVYATDSSYDNSQQSFDSSLFRSKRKRSIKIPFDEMYYSMPHYKRKNNFHKKRGRGRGRGRNRVGRPPLKRVSDRLTDSANSASANHVHVSDARMGSVQGRGIFRRRRGRPPANRGADRTISSIISSPSTSDSLLESSVNESLSNIDQVPVMKKKRGRPRKNPEAKPPTKKMPPAERSPTMRSKTRIRIPTAKVTCAMCHESMTFKDYEMKHMEEHNYLCWIEGDKPVDPNNESDIKYISTRMKKIKKKFAGFKCEKCGVKKKSGAGFVSHRQLCGMSQTERESFKVPCTVCGRYLLPISLRVHMHAEHGKKKVNEDTNVELNTRRAAATRCRSKMEEVLSKVKEEPEEGEEKSMRTPFHKPQTISGMRKLYKQKYRRLIPFGSMRWKEELSKTNQAKCIIPGCSYVASDIKMIRCHFYRCPLAVRDYICRICNKEEKSEAEMQKHLLTEHKEDCTADNELKDYTEEDYNNEENDDDEDNKLDSTGSEEGNSSLNRSYSSSQGKMHKPRWIRKLYHTHGLGFTAYILEEMYKRHISGLPNEALFQEFPATVPENVVNPNIQQYLPNRVLSMKFCSGTGQWRQLERFEGCSFQDSKMMFVGGPVWALAWCPTPPQRTEQYLAIACHPDMDKTHEKGGIHSYNSVIQIWDCGNCDNMKDSYKESPPLFFMGLAHSHGAVWGLEWCPGGCYQPTCGRLGLLAAACSDGKVIIYSVPSKLPDQCSVPIIKMEPTLILELSTSEAVQCSSLAWSKFPPYNILAVGYTDGVVALFNLFSKSPLLRTGNTLYPYHLIQCHNASVNALSFIPKDGGNYLMTASSDRDVKFWNLSDTTSPISTTHKTFITDAVWMGHWLCGASVYDDAFGYGLTSVNASSYRDYEMQSTSPLMCQNCLSWSVAYNEWTNALAVSSEAGEINVRYSRQLFCIEETKIAKKNKKVMTTTNLLKLGNKVTPEKEDHGIRFKRPYSYGEAEEQYGLVMHPASNEEMVCSKREDPIRHFYQITSINKISWNPNFTSFLYLAAGYHAGFVRVMKDPLINNSRIVFDNFYRNKDL